MSLVVQMSRDLDADKKSITELAAHDLLKVKEKTQYTELPLFAAADQIKKQEKIQRTQRFLFIACIAIVILGAYLFSQPTIKDKGFALFSKVFSSTVEQNVKLTVLGNNHKLINNKNSVKQTVMPTDAITVAVNLNADINTELSAHAFSVEETAIEVNGKIDTPQQKITETVAINARAEKPLDLPLNTPNLKQSKKGESTILATQQTQPIKQAADLSAKQVDRQTAVNARQILRSGTIADALAMLEKALANDIDMLESSQMYAGLLISSGEYAKAESVILSYRQRYKSEADFNLLQVRLLMAQAYYEKALVFIGRQTMSGDKSYKLLSLQAAAYQGLKNWTLALQSYQTLLRYDMSRPRWWLGLAIAHDALGNKAEAKQAYQRVVLNGGLEMHLHNYANRRLSEL